MSDAVLLLCAGVFIAVVTLVVLFARPFGGVRRSGDDPDATSAGWIGDSDSGGSDGGGGD